MPNKHFCQGPTCHEQTTSDRFLKSRGVVRGRYAYASIDTNWSYGSGDKFFCSQRCKFDWLELNMPNIEQGRPIEFIRHRRETQGYEKQQRLMTIIMGQELIQVVKLKGLTIGPK
jgi:hypothetical protein